MGDRKMEIAVKEEAAQFRAFFWGLSEHSHPPLASTEIAEALGVRYVGMTREWKESELREREAPLKDVPVTVAMSSAPKFGSFG